jgi:hypothetical protein
MIGLFAKQLQMTQIITDLLKSRGVATDDDVSAFEYVATEDDSSKAAALQAAKAYYLQAAKSFGISTGLEAS